GVVMYIGIARQRVRGTDTLLLVIMSLMDSLIGVTWILFSVGKWYTSYHLLEVPIWCQIQGSISIGALEASSDCAAILALLRYLVIVWRVPVRRIWWDTFSLALVSISLTCAVRSAEMSIVMPVGSYCEPITLQHTTFSRFYSVWLLGRIIVIPVIIIACYGGIIVHYHRLKVYLNYQIHGCEMPKLTQTIKRPHDEINCTIYQLLGVCVAYAVAFLPSLIANIAQVILNAVNQNVYFDAIIIVSIMSIIFINPLFAVLVHHETNHELKSILFQDSFIDSEVPLTNPGNQ
ncbi:hypothetical protein L0F63_005893, partial [Massospora cicadina]